MEYVDEEQDEVSTVEYNSNDEDTDSLNGGYESDASTIEMRIPPPVIIVQSDLNNVRRNLFSDDVLLEASASQTILSSIAGVVTVSTRSPIENDRVETTEDSSSVVLLASHTATGGVSVPTTTTTTVAVLQEEANTTKVNESTMKSVDGLCSTNNLTDDGDLCSICLEAFTNSGDHRVASLHCGHLFGFGCITKWLKGHGARCPQCNRKARRADIRPLYTRSIKALDTTERDRALQELELERTERRKLEMEVAKYRLKYQLAQEELRRLKKDFEERPSPRKQRTDVGQGLSSQLVLTHSVDICREGNCRVMLSFDYCSIMVVSQPNCNPLFPGYGLKKLSSLDYRVFELVPVHTLPIRDVACNAAKCDFLVLTASMDKTLKLTSVISNSVIHTFPTDAAVWSCAWNLDNSYQFFAGLHTGKVLLFDTRVPREEVTELFCNSRWNGGGRAVSSLQYVQTNPAAKFSCGGLVVGRLDGCHFFESVAASEFRHHELTSTEGLDLPGSLTSLSVEPSCRHVMMSCRPGARSSQIRHLVCELAQTSLNVNGDSRNICQSNVVQTFYGGEMHTKLTRSRLIQNPTEPNSTLACAGDEGSASVVIWDLGSGNELHRMPATDTVLDLCPVSVNNNHFLAALTEKRLKVFKWIV